MIEKITEIKNVQVFKIFNNKLYVLCDFEEKTEINTWEENEFKRIKVLTDEFQDFVEINNGFCFQTLMINYLRQM